MFNANNMKTAIKTISRNIAFKRDTTLDIDTQAISAISNDPVDSVRIAFANKLKHGNKIENIQALSNEFAKNLKQSIDDLNKMKTAVSELKNRTDLLNKNILARNRTISSLENIVDTTEVTTPICWEKMNSIGNPLALLARIHAEIDFKEDKFNEHCLTILLNNLTVASALEIAPVPEGDTRTNVIEAIAKSYSHLDREDIDRAFSNIQQGFVFVLNQMRSEISANPGEINIQPILKQYDLYKSVIGAIKSGVLELAESTLAVLAANASFYEKYLDAVAYYLCYMRHEFWKDALIVPFKLVNMDNHEDFVTKGGTQLLLVQFLNDHPNIPLTGYSVNFVFESSKKLEEMHEEERSAAVGQIAAIKEGAAEESFVMTATQYLNDKRVDGDPSRLASDIYNYEKNKTIEDKFYDLIIMTEYKGTLTQKLHKRLSEKYIKHASSTEALSGKDIKAIDTSVYTDLISEFIVKRLIDVK